MTHTQEAALRLAAPAPDAEDDAEDPPPEPDTRPDLDELCEAWANWCRTRRMYVKPSLPVSVLGRLRTKGTGRSASGGPDAIASAELMAFHLAFLSQPEEALDRRVFELHYFRRVKNVKAAAATVGVSRQHWYRLVRDCRERIYVVSRQLLERNLSDRAMLKNSNAQS
jgi:hypothetical protein